MKRGSEPQPMPQSASEIDAFFCSSIVGGPVSLTLGEAIPARNLSRIGLDVSPATLSVRLKEGCIRPKCTDDHGRALTRHHSGLKAALLRHAPWICLLSLLLNLVLAGTLIAEGALP